MFNLPQLDTAITRFIFQILPHNQFFDTSFTFLSLVGSSLFVWLLIVGVVIFFQEKRDKRFMVYFVVSFLITAVLVNIVMKNVYQRSRPHLVTTEKSVFACPADFSFPSGHASAAFASATILCAFDPKRKFAYFTIAALISLSRIYLGCHYFLDVVAGAVIGAAISQIVLSFKNDLTKKADVL